MNASDKNLLEVGLLRFDIWNASSTLIGWNERLVDYCRFRLNSLALIGVKRFLDLSRGTDGLLWRCFSFVFVAVWSSFKLT